MQPKDLVAHRYFQTIVIKSLARMISLFLAENQLFSKSQFSNNCQTGCQLPIAKQFSNRCQTIFKITY